MDEQRTIRVLIDPALSEAHRDLLRQRLERTGRFEIVHVEDPRGHDVKFCAREDILDIAALHNESRGITERMIAELRADHDGNVAWATEQVCPGDDLSTMRGNGRRELRTNAAGTMIWPEAKRRRSRK